MHPLADLGGEVVPAGARVEDQVRRGVSRGQLEEVFARAGVEGVARGLDAILVGLDRDGREVVRPALARGAVVVCDRYVDSMIAYQGAGRVLDSAEIEQVARWATEDLRPDLTVLLDVDHLAAVSVKADKDRVEAAGDAFHARAREHFLELANRHPPAYLVLDARASRDDLADEIRQRVHSLLSVPPTTLEA